MEDLSNLALVAVLGIAVSMFARSRGWGVALPLLLVGAVFSLLPFGPTAPENPEAIQAVVLAPLVFGEAMASSYIDIKKVRRPVLGLAIGLVAITTLVVGGVAAALVTALPLAMAFALGAVLAPTDAVAVATAARRASLPRRVVSILEGESLVNDGTGLTALRVATVAAVAGSVTVAEAGLVLAQSVVVGVAVGAVAGWLLVLVLRHSSDVNGFGGLLLVAPFGVYLVAERLEGSAILAVVIAALMASHASYKDPTYRGRLQVAAVWRQITFVLQAMAFLLLGLELPYFVRALPPADFRLLLIVVPAVTATLIAVRLLVVLGAFRLTFPRAQRTGDRWRSATIVGWAGARGPVSALAAFSIPLLTDTGSALPYRDLVVAASLCVVTLTLLLAPTLGPLARRLGVEDRKSVGAERRVRAAMARAALARLETAEEDADRGGDPLSTDLVQTLRHQAERRLDLDAARTGAVEQVNRAAEVGLSMLRAEQQELLRLRTEEGVPDAVIRPIMGELDRRMATLRASRRP